MRINRITYILLIIVPPAILGFLGKEAVHEYIGYLILFYIPLVSTLRMKSIGMTWKERLMSFIPFYGLRYRYKMFYKK